MTTDTQADSRNVGLSAGLDASEPPRQPKGRDYRDAPHEMDADYLLELALQLRARCCMHNVTRDLFERAKELEAECLHRMASNSCVKATDQSSEAAAGGSPLERDVM